MSIWEDAQGRKHIGIMVGGKRIHRVCPEGASASDAKLIQAELRAALVKDRRHVNIPGDPPMTAILAIYERHAATLRSATTSVHHARRLGPWAEKYRASQAREFAAHVIKDMGAIVTNPKTGKSGPAYAKATINRSLATAKKGLALAWEENLTPENYGLRIKSLKVNNIRDTHLSIKQVEKLTSHASPAVAVCIWLSLYTGCRRGEILSLKPENISRNEITLRSTNTKSEKTRTIPIVGPARKWLKHVPIGINFEGLKSGFRRAREAAGMPDVTFHDLRRSCGTIMIQAGVDLYVVSRILGHSTVAVTQARYAHMQVDTMRAGMKKAFG